VRLAQHGGHLGGMRQLHISGRSNSTPVCRASTSSEASSNSSTPHAGEEAGGTEGAPAGGADAVAAAANVAALVSDQQRQRELHQQLKLRQRAEQVSTMRAFTFLRLGPEMLRPDFQAPWVSFVGRMRQARPTQS